MNAPCPDSPIPRGPASTGPKPSLTHGAAWHTVVDGEWSEDRALTARAQAGRY